MPNYTIAGIQSPEDTIRGLVKSFSGYDMPNIPTGSFRTPSSTLGTMAGTQGVDMFGGQQAAQHFAAQQQQQHLANQRRMQSQINLQQMEHDRVKRDLQDRGLIQ